MCSIITNNVLYTQNDIFDVLYNDKYTPKAHFFVVLYIIKNCDYAYSLLNFSNFYVLYNEK